jgi:hypothetical protein
MKNGEAHSADRRILSQRIRAAKVGAGNVEFRLGEIEHLPVADNTADELRHQSGARQSAGVPRSIPSAEAGRAGWRFPTW